MSKINYKKFKVSINPESVKTQGLKENDIILREYNDSGNIFYTLMIVLSIGADDVVINGVNKSKKWFIGGLLDGVPPKSNEVLDFVRITNLSDEGRMGALYLTASDSDAPYMDVVDSIGKEKSVNYPSKYNEDFESYDRDGYSAIINDYGTVEYLEKDNGVTRAFKLTRNLNTPSVSGEADNFKCLIPTLRNADFQDKKMVVSFKYRSSTISTIPYRISDSNNDHVNLPQQLLQSSSEWKQETALIEVGNLSDKNYFSFGAIASWSSGTWIEIAELNIIPLQSLISWSKSSKSRFGKITGVVDSVFGTLRDYGSYMQRLYASKDVNIAGTLTAGDANGFGSTFYVGKIRKNEIINSLSPEFKVGDNDFVVDSSTFNPVGIGSVYKKGTKRGAIVGEILYQEKTWFDSHLKQKYTMSFWAKSKLNNKTITVRNNDEVLSSFNLTKNWERYSSSFVVAGISEDTGRLTFTLESPTEGDEMFICALQLESGTNTTAYQPTDETLSSSKEYGAWMCRGGVGGTIQNPLLSFRSDGSIYGKDGNFHIHPNGDAEFRGKITIVGPGSNVPTTGEIDSIVADALAGASLDFNDDFAKKLGYNSFADMTDAAAAGSTIISGGYINTVLLDADVIRATIVRSEYIEGLTLNFKKGTIGGFSIDATKLYAGALDYTGGHLAIEKLQSGGRFMASVDGGNYCTMYYYHKDDWGFKGVNRGDEQFSFGSKNQIAGWIFDKEKFVSPSGKIVLSSIKDSIGVFKNSGEIGARVEMKYVSDTDWGLYGLLEDGKDVFRLGSINRIAGWNIDFDKIYTDKIEIGSAGYIRQTQDKWRLNSNGSGSLAGGNIVWDEDGNATFIGTVIISGIGPGGDDEEIVDIIGHDELNVAVDETKGSISSGLGYTDFAEFLSSAVAGKTIIKGGYINTVLLDADMIRATIIKTDYIEGLSLDFIKGTIGGWTLADNQLYNGTNEAGLDNSMIRLSNVNIGSGNIYQGYQTVRGLSLTWNQSNNGGHLVLGQIASNAYTIKQYYFGLQMMDHLGKEYFCLSTNTSATSEEKMYNSIAGWRFDDKKLYSGNIELSNSGYIRQISDKWRLNNDGSGRLANGGIVWDANGNVTFGSNVSLSWSNGITNAQSTANSAYNLASSANTTANSANEISNENNYYLNNTVSPRITWIGANGIFTGYLNADRITAGTINVERLNVSQIVTASSVNALSCNFTKGTIGGWTINASSISKDSMVINSGGGIYNGNFWKLNKDGSGQLSNGRISWNGTGVMQMGQWTIDDSGSMKSGAYQTASGGSYLRASIFEIASDTRRVNMGSSVMNANGNSANLFSTVTRGDAWGLKVDCSSTNAILSQGKHIFKQGNSTWDAPGVLYIGMKTSAPNVTFTKIWGDGMNITSCSYANIRFRFNHNLGHTQYMVQAIGISTSYYSIFRLLSIGADYFDIQVVGTAGDVDFTPFYFVVMGKNKLSL